MTVQELIEALQKVENKQLPVVFTDLEAGEILVSSAEIYDLEKNNGLVRVVKLDGFGF